MPMGISVVSQSHSRVVVELFADLIESYVFNFLEDLLVYSSSPEEHVTHVRDVLSKLQKSAFSLYTVKVDLGASDIKYLGHLISATGVNILPEMATAIQGSPRTVNLRSLRRFIKIVGFYARFIPAYGSVAATLHEFKERDNHSVCGRRIGGFRFFEARHVRGAFPPDPEI